MINEDAECREAMRYSWLGMEFAIIVVAFATGGYFLDIWLNTMPGFTALLGVTGLLAALYRVIRDGMRYRKWLAEHRLKKNQAETDSDRPSGDANQ